MRVKRVLGIIVVIATAVVIAVQLPAVQTRLARKVVEKLEPYLDGKISFSSLKIVANGTVCIDSLVVLDDHPYTEDRYNTGFPPVDTLFRFNRVTATVSLRSLLSSKGVYLRRATIDGGLMHLSSEPTAAGANITRILGLTEEAESTDELGHILTINRIRVSDFTYKMHIFDQAVPMPYDGHGINWADLDVHLDEIRGYRFYIDGNYIGGEGEIRGLDEKSGCHLDVINGKCRAGIDGSGIFITDIEIRDDKSDIYADFSMTYPTPDDFNFHFVDKVRLDGVLRHSRVNLQTLYAFTMGAVGGDLTIDVSHGVVHGPVNDLHLDKFIATIPGMGLSASLKGRAHDLTGTPYFNAEAHDVKYKFKGQTITGEAIAEGPLDSLRADISIGGGLGAAAIKAAMNGLISGEAIEFGGTVSTSNLSLGKVLDVPELGLLSAYLKGSGSIGSSLPEIDLDSLHVSRLGLLGHDYEGITASGSLHDGNARLLAKIRDSALVLSAYSDAVLDGPRKGSYTIAADLDGADLKAMNLDSREGPSEVACKLGAILSMTEGTVRSADLRIDSLKLLSSLGLHDVGDISVAYSSQEDGIQGSLDSRFLDASLTGNKGLYDADLSFGDSRSLLSFLAPGVYIDKGSTLHASISDALDGSISISSPLLAYGAFNLRRCGIDIAKDGKDIDFKASYDNEPEHGHSALLDLSGTLGSSYKELDFSAPFSISADMHPSRFNYKGRTWELEPCTIAYGDDKLAIDGFRFGNAEESLRLDGTYSGSPADTMLVRISNLAIDLVNSFIGSDMGLNGRLDGIASLIGTGGSYPKILAGIVADSLKFGGVPQGRIQVGTYLNDTNEEVSLFARGSKEGRDYLNAAGAYNIRHEAVDLNVVLDRLDLGIATPLLSSISSETSGYVSGAIEITGPLSSPDLVTRNTRLEDASIMVGITGVRYTISGPFKAEPGIIRVEALPISDGGTGKGLIDGTLRYSGVLSPELDLGVMLAGLKVLDRQDGGDALSGSLAISGNAKVKGPLDNLMVEGNIASYGPGKVNVPIGTQAHDVRSSILVFKEGGSGLDPYQEMLATLSGAEAAKRNGNISVKAGVTVSPDVEATVDINVGVGNKLTARGTGNVNLDIRTADDVLDMNGSYVISDGKYSFSIPGVITKDFEIQNGSSVKFGGDFMDSDLDINAVYSTRANLTTLIADSSAVATRKLVQCGISIGDKLRNPALELSVDVPELDPTTRSKVESALSTQDKVQKQFVSLLVLNAFLPDETTGIVNNNGNLLYSNAVDILSNQFNSILQRLEIPVDLGFQYQQGGSGRDMFDVAISTQLWGNRVLVNGNLSNRQFSTGSNSDVLGDIDIQIKLDESGQLRFSVFSHSPDEYSNYLDLLQRNGVGISFQKEFNSLSDSEYKTITLE